MTETKINNAVEVLGAQRAKITIERKYRATIKKFGTFGLQMTASNRGGGRRDLQPKF